MQKTVHENRIERPERRQIRLREIGLDEFSRVPRARHLQVPFVDVEADVLRVFEPAGIRPGATADVEHPPDRQVAQPAFYGRELLRGKRRLPEGVDRRMLHQPIPCAC